MNNNTIPPDGSPALRRTSPPPNSAPAEIAVKFRGRRDYPDGMAEITPDHDHGPDRNADPDSPNAPPGPRRRRARYPGSHPRRFNQRYKELQPQQYPEMAGHIRAQGRTPAGTHVPIMVAEAIEHLAPQAGEIVCDCTLGYGGHAQEFMKIIGPGGRLVGFDVDAAQLERTRARLSSLGVPMSVYRSNFAGIGKALAAEGIAGFDIILADLGVSSMQLDDPDRGFSYKQDGTLDMRMDDRLKHTAADVVRTITEDELSALLLELADEEDHARIARAIVRQRQEAPITRTVQLAHIVAAARRVDLRRWKLESAAGRGELHPAARTFQALRIFVNDELGSLKQLLRAAPYCLRPGGRIGILTFHSGEDRLVKQAFRSGLEAGTYASAADEPIRPGAKEVYDNPRSSGAKFRWARTTPVSK